MDIERALSVQSALPLPADRCRCGHGRADHHYQPGGGCCAEVDRAERCSCSGFKGLAKPYRYEAKVSFILAAEALDEAHDMQRQIVEIVERYTNERVTNVRGSMLDLSHRPDLDGSLRV